MFVFIRLFMHCHQSFCLVLEINNAEGRVVPPPSHTEATNKAARNWQKFNGCTEKLLNLRGHIISLSVSQRPGK